MFLTANVCYLKLYYRTCFIDRFKHQVWCHFEIISDNLFCLFIYMFLNLKLSLWFCSQCSSFFILLVAMVLSAIFRPLWIWLILLYLSIRYRIFTSLHLHKWLVCNLIKFSYFCFEDICYLCSQQFLYFTAYYHSFRSWSVLNTSLYLYKLST